MAYNSQYTGEQVDKAVKIANNNEQVADKVLATDGDGGIKYITPESGTEVVANPTLAGTETDLTGLEVDGVKYKVPSGGSGGGIRLYNHTYTGATGHSRTTISIYTNANVKLTASNMSQYLIFGIAAATLFDVSPYYANCGLYCEAMGSNIIIIAHDGSGNVVTFTIAADETPTISEITL